MKIGVGCADSERDSALGVLPGLGICSGAGPGGGGGRVEGADREEQGNGGPKLGGTVITHPDLSGTSLVLTLKVPCSRRPLRPGQTRMAVHWTC